MNEFLRRLFSSDFMGHGYCYLWKPEIVWLHAISDGLIALSYYLIPVMLIYLVRKRRDLPFHWMFLMFGLFILGCGTTHAMEIWTLWNGTYRLAGVIKAITAGASLATAFALVPLVPRALRLPSPAQLRAANLELEKEIAERRRVEEALHRAHTDLELRVQQRTAELAKANQELQAEITQRRLDEETLRKQASLLDLAHDAIIVRDLADVITYWNAGAEKIYGWKREEAAGKTGLQLLHSMPASRLEDLKAEVIREGRWEGELTATRPDGGKIVVASRWALQRDAGGQPLAMLQIDNDITGLKRTQEETLARQKLESLGVLAGGIAHDFNNLLGAILAEAELAGMQLASGESPIGGIQRINTVARRGAEIVRELMIYSGQDQVDPLERLDLSRLVDEMLELLKVSISKHAVLKTDLHQNLPPVQGRASQIRQIVMNLVINASEAIGEKGGVIKVAVSRIALARDSGPGSPQHVPAGDYLNLEVSDRGGGMSEEVQAKVFDPFFTTKFAGRGLGLAVVQGIVRDHGGAIHLVSAPGEGTTFRILLPCVGEPSPPNRAVIAPASQNEHRPRSGTILIVEDEDVLRIAVSRMLRKKGFRVIEASDGSSALEHVRAHTGELDVMLLDVTLPGVSSREVLEASRQVCPHLKVILTSAYSRETVDASFAGLPIGAFIRKPFQLVELVGVMELCLDTPPPLQEQ